VERLRWREVLEQDFENIRSVLKWGLEDPAGRVTAEQITTQMVYFWPFCGYMSEGLQYFRRFTMLMDSDTPSALRADLLCFSGIYDLMISGQVANLPLIEEGISFARQAADKKVLARCLQWGGLAAMSTGNAEMALEELRESLALLRDLGDKWSEVQGLLWLSEAQRLHGEQDLARQTLEQCILLGRGGDPSVLTAPLGDLVQEALSKGDLEAAKSILLEIDSLARPVGDFWSLAWSNNMLAQIDLKQAQENAATTHVMEALELARLSGNRPVIALALVEAAVILARRAASGDAGQRAPGLAHAAQLCVASRDVVADTRITSGPAMRRTYDKMLAEVQAKMEAPVWEAAFAEGAAMPVERAIDLALAEIQAL
jgi:tetratricopeptide (TPR) repeat protein